MPTPRHPARVSPLAPVEWSGAIERPGWGGLGVARADDGRVILLSAPLALLPGEAVRAQVRWRARHGEGEVVEWLRADPRREAPGCPVAERCGGCQLWGAGELYGELKRAMVADLFRRSLPNAPAWDWQPALKPWGEHGALRHRIQLHWDGVELGFHAPASNAVVPVDACPLAVAPVSEAIPLLRAALRAGELPTAPDRWELAAGTPPGGVQAAAESLPDQAWRASSAGWTPCREPLIHHLGEVQLDQPAGTFFQGCPAWAWPTLGAALTAWDLRGGTLYDLFGGVGLFSALLAGRFARYVLVESAPDAVEGARVNLTRLGLTHELVLARVADWLAREAGADSAAFTPQDVLILDPPRAGLGPELCDHLSRAGAGTLVLAGCDGAAFCRDVRALSPTWQLSALTVVDLFPNTTQVECMGLLRRK